MLHAYLQKIIPILLLASVVSTTSLLAQADNMAAIQPINRAELKLVIDEFERKNTEQQQQIAQLQKGFSQLEQQSKQASQILKWIASIAAILLIALLFTWLKLKRIAKQTNLSKTQHTTPTHLLADESKQTQAKTSLEVHNAFKKLYADQHNVEGMLIEVLSEQQQQILRDTIPTLEVLPNTQRDYYSYTLIAQHYLLEKDLVLANLAVEKTLQYLSGPEQKLIARHNYAFIGLKQGQLQTALQGFNALVPELKRHTSDQIQALLAQNYINQGEIFQINRQYNQSLECYQSAIQLCEKHNHPLFERALASAHYNRGVAETDLKQLDNALRDYHTVITRFSKHPARVLQLIVAKSHINQAVIYAQLSKYAQAIQQFDAIIHTNESSTDPDLEIQRLYAFSNKAVLLHQQKRYTDEIATYTTMIQRYAQHTHPQIANELVHAYVNRIMGYEATAQHELAQAEIQALIKRYGHSQDEAILESCNRIAAFKQRPKT